LQRYFEDRIRFVCGIPSVALLGKWADWEMLNRIDMLPRLGSEPAQFCALETCSGVLCSVV